MSAQRCTIVKQEQKRYVSLVFNIIECFLDSRFNGKKTVKLLKGESL